MRLIAIEEHILPPDVRNAWASAPPPHDPVSAFATVVRPHRRTGPLRRLRIIPRRAVG